MSNLLDPFRIFTRSAKCVKHEMWVSVQLLLVLTVILAVLYYLIEGVLQGNEKIGFFDSFIWMFALYVDDIGGLIREQPATLVGQVILTLAGYVGVLIFAIPAGLLASGFNTAIDEEKRENEITKYHDRLRKAFKRQQNKATMYRCVPLRCPLATIQAERNMDTKDIIDVVENYPKEFRLRNLAATQPQEEHPVDRLAVELIPYSEATATSYGCRIDRGSKVTIVAATSVGEHGTGYFAYHLALFGNFNYISKEYNADPDNPTSYYLIGDEKAEKPLEDFLSDVRALGKGEDKWVICILSCESSRPHDFNFIHKVKEELNIQKTTIIHEEVFQQLYGEMKDLLQNNYELTAEQDVTYRPVAKKNLMMKLNGGVDVNAFSLRIVWKVTAWDSRVLPIIRDVSKVIKKHCEPNQPWEENPEWKDPGFGYFKEVE